jgi:hypothetical protein
MKIADLFEIFDEYQVGNHDNVRRGDLVRFKDEVVQTFSDRKQPPWKAEVRYGIVTSTVMKQSTELTGEVVVVFIGPDGKIYGQSDIFWPNDLIVIAHKDEYVVANENNHFRPHYVVHRVFGNLQTDYSQSNL